MLIMFAQIIQASLWEKRFIKGMQINYIRGSKCLINCIFYGWPTPTGLFSPLKSKFAREYEVPTALTSPDYSGPASLDMIGSIRPKIYLLIHKITQAVNTEAQLFDSLSLKNQVRPTTT